MNVQTMNIRSVLVAIASRLKRNASGELFLRRAMNSIFGQTAAAVLDITVAVGIDSGTPTPPEESQWARVKFRVGGSTEAAAVNAAASEITNHDVLAFLEDDDEWHPKFLETALPFLQYSDFVSSTQLEVSPDGTIISVADFPTPSGWLMKRQVWEFVGPFNENYLYHLDNEWLGRLSLSRHKRIHLVESTAPISRNVLYKRPTLVHVLTNAGDQISLARHTLPVPLVKRLIHSGSGSWKEAAEPAAASRGAQECEWLKDRFGRIPC